MLKERGFRCETLLHNCTQLMGNISTFPTILPHKPRYFLCTIPSRACVLTPILFLRELMMMESEASSEDAPCPAPPYHTLRDQPQPPQPLFTRSRGAPEH